MNTNQITTVKQLKYPPRTWKAFYMISESQEKEGTQVKKQMGLKNIEIFCKALDHRSYKCFPKGQHSYSYTKDDDNYRERIKKKLASINFPRSNFGAFRILTFRMKTFCKGKMLVVTFSISLPITSGMNFWTNSFKSQDVAWLIMISLILRWI